MEFLGHENLIIFHCIVAYETLKKAQAAKFESEIHWFVKIGKRI